MKGTGTLEETFYIIATESGYWYWGNGGQRIDCWGDPATAERFDTKEEAETCIDEYFGEYGDKRPSVLCVTQTTTVKEA